MKKLLSVILFLLCFNYVLFAVSNLQISPSIISTFSLQEVVITFNFSQVGAKTDFVKIWYDVNGNGVIDQGDLQTKQEYSIVVLKDGSHSYNSVERDFDNAVNGQFESRTKIRLPKGKYILQISDNGQVDEEAFEVVPFIPANSKDLVTVSGRVTNASNNPIPGLILLIIPFDVLPDKGDIISKFDCYNNIFAKDNEDNENAAWAMAITNANGEYCFYFLPEFFGSNFPMKLAVTTPQELIFDTILEPSNSVPPAFKIITLNGTNNIFNNQNMQYTSKIFSVNGTVKDQYNTNAPNISVSMYVQSVDTETQNLSFIMAYSYAKTNQNGQYTLPGNLKTLGTWQVSFTPTNNNYATSDSMFVHAMILTPPITPYSMPVGFVRKCDQQFKGKVMVQDEVTKQYLPAEGVVVQAISGELKTYIANATLTDSVGNFTLPVVQGYAYRVGIYTDLGTFIVEDPANGFYNNVTPPMTNLNFQARFTIVGINNNDNKYYTRNYPNPFNPSTVICYQLSDNTKSAELKIFNIQGKLVYNEKLNIKQNKIIWNGIDNNNNKLSSGIYYYMITSDDGIKLVNKMLLLK